MRKNVKGLFVAGIVLCAAGAGLFAVGAATGGIPYAKASDLNKMNGKAKIQENAVMEKTKLEPIDRLEIQLGDADLEILPSGDENYYLSYTLPNAKTEEALSYKEEDGCLMLSDNRSNGKFIQIDISFISWMLGGRESMEENKVTLYVPETSAFENSRIEISDGDLELEGSSWKNTELELHYGDIELKDCIFDGGKIVSSDGSMEAQDLELKDLQMEFRYGDVEWNRVSAKDCGMKLSDGNLEAEKLDITGNLEIRNAYGDVEVQLADACREALSMELQTKYGDIELADDLSGEGRFTEQEDKASYERTVQDGRGMLTVEVSDGNIEVE